MVSRFALPASVALSLLPFLPHLKAQTPADNSSSNTILQELTAHLNDSGYINLATALSGTNQPEWISQLSQGTWTLFAPTNQAFTQAPQNVTSNATLLAEHLSYHFVYGNQQNTSADGSRHGGGGGGGGSHSSSGGSQSTTSQSTTSAASSETSSASQSQDGQFSTQATNFRYFKRSWNPFVHQFQAEGSGAQLSSGIYPNVTLGRTLLNSSDLVQLEGGKSQVLAWTRSGPDGNVTILNQAPNVTVSNATQWRNFFIVEVNGTLIPPGNLTTALQATNATTLLQFGNQIQLPAVNGTNVSAVELIQEEARGFTFFAPTDQAFTSQGNAGMEAMQGNQTAITDAILNHYVNGSTLYSPNLQQIAANSSSSSAQQTVVSAGGQPFTFSYNQTGLFVSNGNGTEAQVVRPDVLVENGVVHIIDHVLFNSGSNPSAASSAFSSASAAATQTSTDTQAVGIIPQPAGTQTQSGAGGQRSSASMTSTAAGGGQSGQSSASQSQQSQSSTQSASQTSQSGGGGGGDQSTQSTSSSATPSAFRFRRSF